MDDNTHFIIERDGEYLEHYGVKGMKWKEHNSNYAFKVSKYEMANPGNKRFRAGEKQEKVKGTYGSIGKGGHTVTKIENRQIGLDNKSAERNAAYNGSSKDISRYQRSKYDNKSSGISSEKKKKKKGKVSSWISGKAKDASVAYESGKSRLKKLFGG